MSKTPDLDKAIETVQGYLEATKDVKVRLQVMDRLTRMLALKYKHNVQGKGGKFAAPGEK